jgi:hypothetical protein
MYRDTGKSSIILGIALRDLKVGDGAGIYVLVPLELEPKAYCEVEIVSQPEFEWCLIDDVPETITFDCQELGKDKEAKLNEATEKTCYWVWDDGASKHHERAAKLYSFI